MLKISPIMSIIGGIGAAIGASLCCVGPLFLLVIGVNGAWIANLTVLGPYSPFFIVLVLSFFTFAGWQIFKPQALCDSGTACSFPKVRRRRKIIYIITLFIAFAMVSSPYWIPILV